MQPIRSVGTAPLAPLSTRPAHFVTASSSSPAFTDVLAAALVRLDAVRQPETQGAAGSGAESADAQRIRQTLHTATQMRDQLLAAYEELKDIRI